MQQVSLKDLLEAGCHFGHKSDRWHPKAAEFIYQERGGIHVIDLAKTKAGLEKAAEYIRDTVQKGGNVLFIGTKRQAGPIIRKEAERVGAPYISQRWIGGFLTNWEQIHKNLQKIRKLTEEEKTDAWKKYPKHERVKLSRYLKKLMHFYGGVVSLLNPPDAIMVIDIKREAVALHEAHVTNKPIVGVVDTNADPAEVNYSIPSNDDAVGAIEFLVHYLAEAYLEGKNAHMKEVEEKNKVEKVEKVDKIEKKVEEKKEIVETKTEEVKPAEKPKKKATRTLKSKN